MNNIPKKKTSVSIPADVVQQIADRAKKENRNFSNMTTVLILEGLKTKAA